MSLDEQVRTLMTTGKINFPVIRKLFFRDSYENLYKRRFGNSSLIFIQYLFGNSKEILESSAHGFIGAGFRDVKNGVLIFYGLDSQNKVLNYGLEIYSEADLNPLNLWTLEEEAKVYAIDISCKLRKPVLIHSRKKGFSELHYDFYVPTSKGVTITQFEKSE